MDKVAKNEAKALHEEAMELAEAAFVGRAKGALDSDQLAEIYRKAWPLEAEAARMIPDGSEPTRSVFFRSAATMAMDAGDKMAVRQLVKEGLAGKDVPADIMYELSAVQTEVAVDIPGWRPIDAAEIYELCVMEDCPHTEMVNGQKYTPIDGVHSLQVVVDEWLESLRTSYHHCTFTGKGGQRFGYGSDGDHAIRILREWGLLDKKGELIDEGSDTSGEAGNNKGDSGADGSDQQI